ncbi:uncharacterized protein LOC128730112 [Anopheles nili]|uniref:uncharacterized protein LOC128730112 n=1 Tax=Anopheles nili TaxID=185578 RepID=UPI00237A092A|nr:uncharacterized protein LOC128730112 [Anopheles nili]
MEEYKKLLWSKHNPRSEGKLLEQASIDFADFQDDIFNLHINEIDPIHQIDEMNSRTGDPADITLPVEMPIDPRTGQKVEQLELKCINTLQLFDRFPSGSVLKRKEHQHCLTVLNRINMRLPFTNPEDAQRYQQYQKLMEKLAPEKELFDSFVRNFFNTNLLRRVQTIDPDMNALVVAIWQEKVSERLALERERGGKYILMTAVPFGGNNNPCQSNVIFKPMGQDAQETGVVRNLFTENILRCVSLKRNARVLDGFMVEWRAARRRYADKMSDIFSILYKMPQISIVLSAGVLAWLINNARNEQEQWTVPFQVKTLNDRNVLLVDSRHPACRMSTHVRKLQAHKLLVKSFMSFIKPQSTTEGSSKTTTEQKSQEASKCNGIASFDPLTFDEYMKKVELRRAPSGHETRENRFYQPWTLEEDSETHHLLISFRQDCYESFRKMRVFMNISVKLEYQPEFGAEQMTLAELLHEWCRQLLRPNSKTMRLRVNATTSIIISHHYLELRDIEEELNRLYGVQPRSLIGNVWKMLKLLQNFPPGDYLLQRDGKSAQSLSVYSKILEKEKANQAELGAVTINWSELLLRTEYSCPPLEQYDWIPIDKYAITYLHRQNTLLPCSFPHWTSVRKLNSRQPKPKAPPPKPSKKKGVPNVDGGKPAKKSSAGKLLKREKMKLRKQEARKKMALAEKIQQSLNQFAPYSGSTKVKPHENSVQPKDGSNEGSNKSGLLQAPLSVHQSVVDYNTYVEQSGIKPDEK